MGEDDKILLVADDDGVRTITLNRSDVLNAFNKDLLKALGKATRDAARDRSVRCVVMTGAGRAFCSGQDLAEVADRYTGGEPIDFGTLLRGLYNPISLTIRTMEKPVIASVNGVAAGAGCALALVCDIRVAAESASFIEAFVNVGLVPDSGATFMLPRLVGLARSMELAMTGRKVGAEEAHRIGLVNHIIPDGELAARTRELARTLADKPARAVALTKRAINSAWSSDLEAQLDYEAMLQTTAGWTDDHREGVTSFLEKRPPKFTGK